jgi:outer membrane protein OmpA-like peptidoglycan-associated protein
MTESGNHYWERCRRGAAPLIVGAIGIAGLGAAQLMPVRHRMEEDLRARSLAALSDAGLTGIEAEFTGQDGVLKGTVASAADATRALRVIESLEGVRAAQSELVVSGGPSPSTNGTGAPTAEAPTVDTASPIPTPIETTSAIPTPTEITSAIPTPTEITSAIPTPTEITSAIPTPTEITSAVPTPATTADPPTETPPATGVLTSSQVKQRLRALPAIRFGHDSARLTPPARHVVSQVAAILKASPETSLRLEGFTDNTGSWNVNLTVGTARAAAVRRALIADGVAPGRLIIVGCGEGRPKVPNTSKANRAINRRVELTVP